MKVAVSSTQGDAASAVEQRFGRTPWFVVFDTETDQHVVLDNTSAASAASGAGVASAQRVIDAGAECVLTGRCGPKAAATLTQAGVRIVDGIEGNVLNVVERFIKGEL